MVGRGVVDVVEALVLTVVVEVPGGLVEDGAAECGDQLAQVPSAPSPAGTSTRGCVMGPPTTAMVRNVATVSAHPAQPVIDQRNSPRRATTWCRAGY